MKTAMTDASSYARLDTVHPSDDGWAADIIDGGFTENGRPSSRRDPAIDGGQSAGH
jgi:hypothetical protein